MIFNDHSKLAGTHAFLSASNYHWINYEDDKLDRAFLQAQAARRGTRLHEFAKEAITLGIKLPDVAMTMNMYVNDAIGFGMVPEQTLFYSINCYGTADTIGFRMNKLRIHDYKSGVVKANERQLYVYGALFCLEYEHDPHDIDHEYRIYQNNDVYVYEVDVELVAYIMRKIKAFHERIENLKKENL